MIKNPTNTIETKKIQNNMDEKNSRTRIKTTSDIMLDIKVFNLNPSLVIKKIIIEGMIDAIFNNNVSSQIVPIIIQFLVIPDATKSNILVGKCRNTINIEYIPNPTP